MTIKSCLVQNLKNGEYMCKTLILCAILAICLVIGASAEQTKTIVHRAVDGPITEYPVVLDDMEDMIAYDSDPHSYFPNALTPGTMFAVRFTPDQACSLTYIQVVSYDGSGNASQFAPAVSLAENNSFVVAWEDERNGNSDIYAQYYAADGQPLGNNLLVNAASPVASQKNPALSPSG